MRKYLVTLLLLSQLLVWAEEVVRPIRVGLVLPLQVEALKRDKNMNRFVDFYTGALLAVYEMQEKGQRVEVYTYDVGKNVRGMQLVLNSGQLDSVDMVIGPAYTSQVRLMAEWANEHKVMTLLPFSSDVPEVQQNPYLMQFNPSVDQEATKVAGYLFQRPVRCIFINPEGADIPESVRRLQTAIIDAEMDYTYTSIGAILSDSLVNVLSEDKENVLITNTERYANLRTMMPYINRAAQGRQLTLFSRYSWQNEPIILPQIYSTIFKMEDDSTAMVQYEALYRRFIAQPVQSVHPRYDLLGYDIMGYVLQTILGIRQTEVVWEMDAEIEKVYNGVQSDIHFERVNAYGGYNNIEIFTVRK